MFFHRRSRDLPCRTNRRRRGSKHAPRKDPLGSVARRSLRLEPLEERSLLAVGVSGWVNADLSRNGSYTAPVPDGTVVEVYSTTDSVVGNGDDALRSTAPTYGGSYTCSGLDEGLTYYVKVIAPAGYAFATQQSNLNEVDTNGYSAILEPQYGWANCNAMLVPTSTSWAFQLGGTNGSATGNAIVRDAAGDFYVIGSFQGTVDFDPGTGLSIQSSDSRHGYLAKYSSDGNLIWVNDLSSLHATEGIDVDIDSDGHVFATGNYFQGNSGGFFVTALNPDGTTIWTKNVALPNYTPGVSDRDTVTALSLSPYGQFVEVVGCFSGTVNFNPDGYPQNLTSAGDQDAFYVCLNAEASEYYGPDGDFRAARRYGEAGYDAARAVDDGFFTGVSGDNCFVARVGIGYDFWVKTTVGAGSATGTAIKHYRNRLYVAGYFQGTVDFDSSDEVHSLTAAPTSTYSTFLLSLTDTQYDYGFSYGNGSVISLGNSDSASAVDLRVMPNGTLCAAYAATDTDPSASQSNRYVITAPSTWTATAIYSTNETTPWAAGGCFAIGDDWTIDAVGSFCGTAKFGFATADITATGQPSSFIAQFSPHMFRITNVKITDGDFLDNQVPAGTAVVRLSAQDFVGAVQYSLVPDLVDKDNDCFYVDGDILRCTDAFAYKGKDTYYIRVRATDELGQWTEEDLYVYARDNASPRVTINQADDQADPAEESPIHFRVVFNEPCELQADSITINGTAPGTPEVSVDRVGYDFRGTTTYDVIVRGMTGPGTVIATIAAGAVTDRAGNPNLASTSTDNVIDYAPTSEFQDIGALGLPGVGFGQSVWGDYDNDGLLDVLVAGRGYDARGYHDITRVYHNDGNNSFHDIGVNFLTTSLTSLGKGTAWADYDNDGRLDLLISGTHSDSSDPDPSKWLTENVTKLYHNDGNDQFHEVTTGLSEFGGTVAWGDYDNDGRLDLLVNGVTNGERVEYITRVYHNDGDGIFHDIDADLPARSTTAASWGDYDNDGRLDILLDTSGQYGVPTVSLYHNDGNGVFRDVTNGLGYGDVQTSQSTWGDFDNDGQLDILLSVYDGNSHWHAEICHNDGNGEFHSIATDIPAAGAANMSWADYDRDGYLDILINMRDVEVAPYMKVYHNDRDGSFSPISITLPGTYMGSVQWGDYDADGYLDILQCGMDRNLEPYTRIYRNIVADRTSQTTPQAGMALMVARSALMATSETSANTAPAAPTSLTSTPLSATSVLLSWRPATDGETPQAGLSYVLRVGTTPDGCDIVSPDSDSDGIRHLAERGTIQGTSWTLNGLTAGKTYYWSVQAIDTSFVGSAFAAEQTFIGGGPTTFQLTGPTGTHLASRGVTIRWNAENVSPYSKISLCYDEDAIRFNGNEHWIEIDQVSAANGTGSYTWMPTGIASGKYYIAGYLWSDGRPTFSHLTQPITLQVPPPTFTLTGPTSGTFTPGDTVAINWTAGNVLPGSKVSLCYDEDKVWFNGNEHWIEIDQVDAANGAGSYNWNTTGLRSGTYYVAGYLWSDGRPTFSHLTQPITVEVPPPTFTLTGPTSGTFTPGDTVTINWTASNVLPGSKVTLCYDEDKVWFNGNEHWIEIDQVDAANGAGSYNWNTTGLRSGAYYVAGYLWSDGRPTFFHMSEAVTLQTFRLDFAIGNHTKGDTIPIRWLTSDVVPDSKVSLCYDEDRTWWNGNEYWIEIDQCDAANGNPGYSWNTTGVPAGIYYLGGYLFSDGAATFHHAPYALTISDARGPEISQIWVAEQSGPRDSSLTTDEALVATWNVADSDAVTSLQIDGENIPTAFIFGPYAAGTGSNYSVLLNRMTVGLHQYIVSATEPNGNVAYHWGCFSVVAAQSIDASALPQDTPSSLRTEDLVPLLCEAKQRWLAAPGITTSAMLDQVSIEVADLPGSLLGETEGTIIRIDHDAAGYRWFVDTTPSDDAEFSGTTDGTYVANKDSAAERRVDLLTTVMHELGHLLGKDHSVDGLMRAALPLGVRASILDEAFARYDL